MNKEYILHWILSIPAYHVIRLLSKCKGSQKYDVHNKVNMIKLQIMIKKNCQHIVLVQKQFYWAHFLLPPWAICFCTFFSVTSLSFHLNIFFLLIFRSISPISILIFDSWQNNNNGPVLARRSATLRKR